MVKIDQKYFIHKIGKELLKSGEDIITDLTEMRVGQDEESRVVGYFFEKPCVIKMRNPQALPEEQDGNTQKAGYEVSLFPWLPLTPETKIPVAADWLITMVEPTAKLKEMYVEDVVNYGKDDKNTGTVQ